MVAYAWSSRMQDWGRMVAWIARPCLKKDGKKEKSGLRNGLELFPLLLFTPTCLSFPSCPVRMQQESPQQMPSTLNLDSQASRAVRSQVCMLISWSLLLEQNRWAKTAMLHGSAPSNWIFPTKPLTFISPEITFSLFCSWIWIYAWHRLPAHFWYFSGINKEIQGTRVLSRLSHRTLFYAY